MADYLFCEGTPQEVRDAKGLHLITQNTPNGQATQILLEELKAKYGLDWTTQVIDISTNVQKEECKSCFPKKQIPASTAAIRC
jgi:glutathione S-transferase